MKTTRAGDIVLRWYVPNDERHTHECTLSQMMRDRLYDPTMHDNAERAKRLSVGAEMVTSGEQAYIVRRVR